MEWKLPHLAVAGVAVPFNVTAWLDGELTALRPGCFEEDELSRREIELRINHGSKAIGSTTVFEIMHDDGPVLFFGGQVEHADWPELLERLDGHGLIHGASIKFRSLEQDLVGGVCVVSQARLTEISLIVNEARPAFAGTSIRLGNLWKPGPGPTAAELAALRRQIDLAERLRKASPESALFSMRGRTHLRAATGR
jgi:hypothetical protein